MRAMSQNPAGRRSARAALWIGLSAPVCAVCGAILANYEITTPFVGFRLFLASLPLSLAGILAAMVALFNTRQGRNPAGRARGITAATAGVLTIAVVAGLVAPTVGLPLINDISTDLSDPPQFVHAATLPANAGSDLAYPADFAEQQRQGYPTLASLRLDAAPEDVFERVHAAMKGLRDTRVTHVDADAGVIEAVSVSRVFHFVDDVIVRVRDAGGQTVVDARSRSRDGKGDLGTNAARIEALFLVLR